MHRAFVQTVAQKKKTVFSCSRSPMTLEAPRPAVKKTFSPIFLKVTRVDEIRPKLLAKTEPDPALCLPHSNCIQKKTTGTSAHGHKSRI